VFVARYSLIFATSQDIFVDVYVAVFLADVVLKKALKLLCVVNQEEELKIHLKERNE
jgi:hypothetical protein